MKTQQEDNKTAVSWIEGEFENLILDVGKPNASAAVTSVITLAFLLKVIDEDEHRHFRSRIDKIYKTYNASLASVV